MGLFILGYSLALHSFILSMYLNDLLLYLNELGNKKLLFWKQNWPCFCFKMFLVKNILQYWCLNWNIPDFQLFDYVFQQQKIRLKPNFLSLIPISYHIHNTLQFIRPIYTNQPIISHRAISIWRRTQDCHGCQMIGKIV